MFAPMPMDVIPTVVRIALNWQAQIPVQAELFTDNFSPSKPASTSNNGVDILCWKVARVSEADDARIVEIALRR